MKKLVLLATAMIALASTVNAQLIITGVWDGPLTGGLPKGIEFYATEDIADLSLYELANYNNGNTTATAQFALSGSALQGDYLYFSFGASESATSFQTYFGFAPTFFGNALNVNGDDAITIQLVADDSILDVYGVIGQDGTGQVWDYLDGWAYRLDGTTASSSFVSGEWNISGIDALDGTTTNSQIPVGTFTPVPEPASSALFLGGFGAMLWVIRRKRVIQG